MGEMIAGHESRVVIPFNSPVEVGLRSLCILTAMYPLPCSLQQLVVFDYLLVHSDDIPSGPKGLHPKTPQRSGEILVRRGVLQNGLFLYQSRGLIECVYQGGGVYYAASDRSAGFVDALSSEYVIGLQERAAWVANNFGHLNEEELGSMAREHIGEWGTEFDMESVLWAEEES